MFVVKKIFVRYVGTTGTLVSLKELYCLFFGDVDFSFLLKMIVFCIAPLLVCAFCEIKDMLFSVYEIADTDAKISLSYGDLLKKKGVVVIPVNQEFDTLVGNGIVSPKSLHGKFINKFFKNELSTLDALISSQLKDVPFENRPEKKKGNRRSYPLGTCVQVEKNNSMFILAALTKFDDECVATAINEVARNTFLSNVWTWIANHAEPSDVYMPLIGSGNSRMKGTSFEKYKAVVDSGVAAITERKLFQKFQITLMPCCDNFGKHEQFVDYLKLKALYRETSAIGQENVGSGITV